MALLAGSPELAALVGPRIRWGRMPAAGAVLPYVTLAEIELPRVYTADGGTGRRRCLVQADAWGGDDQAATEVSDAVISALDGYRGQLAGVRILSVMVDGIRDLDAGDLGDRVATERRSIDFAIRWEPVA